jgi:site-specific recombinase XerD
MIDDSRSRDNLLSFLDYCKDKGLMKPSTAEARKAAVNQVLGILNESEAADVAKIEVDHLLGRFQNLHGKRYTPASLKTYRARVRNSIEEFLRYLQNPMDFQPKGGNSVRKVPNSKGMSPQMSPRRSSLTEETVSRTVSAPPTSTSTLPIPLRFDLTVLIHGLPFDLSHHEARKIANVVLAMAGADES